MACGNWWNLTEMNIANYVIICFCSVVFLCVFFFWGGGIGFYVIQRNSQPLYLFVRESFVVVVDSQATRSSMNLCCYIFTIAYNESHCFSVFLVFVLYDMSRYHRLFAVIDMAKSNFHIDLYPNNTRHTHTQMYRALNATNSNWRRNKFMAYPTELISHAIHINFNQTYFIRSNSSYWYVCSVFFSIHFCVFHVLSSSLSLSNWFEGVPTYIQQTWKKPYLSQLSIVLGESLFLINIWQRSVIYDIQTVIW